MWPSIAVDPNGNAYAVWADHRSGTDWDIYFSYRPAGGDWQTNDRVDDDATGEDQRQPSIAVDPNGNAYAVWQDERSGTDWDIYFSYRPAGGDWQTNDRVDDDATGEDQRQPSIAVDPNGNAYAVWQDERSGTDWDIYFSYRPAGGDWQTNAPVDDDAGTADQKQPSIAVDPNGNAYAVWGDGRNGIDDIYFSYRPAGGSWGANDRVDDDGTGRGQGQPSIAVDPNGNAYAVWGDFRSGTDHDIYFSYRPAGGEWQTNAQVDDDATGADQRWPSIAVDPCGTAYAVWWDWRNGNDDIYFSHRPAGGDWQTNVRVNDDGTGRDQHEGSIAVDRCGNAYAVWQEWDGTDWDIYFSYLPAPVSCCVVEEEFVPEWGSIALLGSGLAGLAGYASLRWRKS